VERSRLSLFGVVLLAVVTLGWGFAWPFIKIVLAEVSPLTYRSICLLGGNSEQIKIELCSSHVIVRTKGQESHQIAALIRSGLGGDKLDPWLKMLSQ